MCRFGVNGVSATNWDDSSGASLRAVSACLMAARAFCRSVVTGVGSMLTRANDTATARVSFSVRSPTTSMTLTSSSSLRRRPMFALSFAVNAAASVPPVPPSSFARASHSSRVHPDPDTGHRRRDRRATVCRQGHGRRCQWPGDICAAAAGLLHRRDKRPGDLGYFPCGFADILNHRSPSRSGVWRWIAVIAGVAQDRQGHRDDPADTVHHVVGHHQGHHGRTVGEGENAQPPTGPSFGINRQLRTLVKPLGEFRTRAGAFGDVQFRRVRI